MSQTPKRISTRRTEKIEISSRTKNPVEEKGLSISGLKTVHEKLTALHDADEEADITRTQRKSIHALIAYAACNLGVNEEVVGTLVKRHFDVTDFKEMQESGYEDLVRFLENLDIKRFIN